MKAWQYIQKGWCQGSEARTKTGKKCSTHSPNAAAWCLAGALHKIYSADERGVIDDRIYELIDTNIIDWNDDPKRTKAEVIALLKKAERGPL